ncbi:tetratricopeptide repeat protein [Commensalibacter nepenthis]|uniref:Tetratricopeptide repeat protein n=1 Tax=Commensalibacter nepenthis TaxID=3043872 RepID=A0ABT6Q5M3_9PROT|nr:hypothetical protein [Commensalibacter sp. TBRC 10068]MDI2112193.1 hypothetical protein [Commensalibacter sp. TBRC 10068]
MRQQNSFFITIIGLGIGLFSNASLARPVFSEQQLSNLTIIRPFADLSDAITRHNHDYENSKGQQQKKRLLSVNYLSLLNKDRTCPQTDVAYQQALELYKKQQWTQAQTAFTALIGTGSEPQQVCVSFKLGQVENQLGNHAKASRLFVKTYKLVADKAYPDPLHLGIDALGESAGAMLDQIGTRSLSDKGIVIWKVGPYKENPPSSYEATSILGYEGMEIHENSQDLFEKIIDYYTTQVTLGHDKAIDSISAVFTGITDPDNPNAPVLLKDALYTDRIRDILWAYLFNAQKGIYYISDPKIRIYIENFIIKTIDGTNVDIGGTEGYLAALAFQNNDLAKAHQFAQFRWNVSQQTDPLAAWVLAKIAYKKGDIDTAKSYYSKALLASADEKTPKILQQYITEENYMMQSIKKKDSKIIAR